MSLVKNLVRIFVQKNISIDIDPILLPDLDTEDKLTTSRIIDFRLDKLILNVGLIESRFFATSNRLKWFDKVELLEKIYDGTDDFRIKIKEIRERRGPEDLTTISAEFGVGVSICVAESLFNLNRSTIEKLTKTGSRPDWRCQTATNKILVVEAKGSTNKYTSRAQEAKAILQKENEPGDIKVASVTLFKEDEISTNRFVDPPIEPNENNPRIEKLILRAGHYASMFSFLGNSRLSRYYLQLKKRLSGDITEVDQIIKNREFRSLNVNSPTIEFENKIFTGSFYEVDENQYLFVGVDKRLLSFEGFIEFEDYQSDIDEVINENHYVLYRDGILIIEIDNIQIFHDKIKISEIQNYQEKITISDIDSMSEIAFSKYLEYILKKNGFSKLEEEVKMDNLFFNIAGEYNGKTYIFEIKLGKKLRSFQEKIDQMLVYKNRYPYLEFVLITNSKNRNLQNYNYLINIIFREDLRQIALDNSKIISFLNT